MKKHLLLRYISIALIVIAVIGSVTVGSVLYARYMTKFTDESQNASSQEMYFEANFAAGGLYLIPSGSNFPLVIKNYDNLGNYSTSNVAYKVMLNGVEKASGNLSGGQKSQDDVELLAADLLVDNTYSVSIFSTSPYQKEISFRIQVVSTDIDNYYSVKDMGNWIQLDLYIGTTVPTSLSVEYGTLAPDNTHDLMKTWKTADGIATFTGLKPYSHYTLIFFGDDEVATVEKTLLESNSIKLD